jgi:hypothetical protein
MKKNRYGDSIVDRDMFRPHKKALPDRPINSPDTIMAQIKGVWYKKLVKLLLKLKR